MEPVGMTSTSTRAWSEPSRMMVPLPNCFSSCSIARSSARARSFFSSAISGSSFFPGEDVANQRS